MCELLHIRCACAVDCCIAVTPTLVRNGTWSNPQRWRRLQFPSPAGGSRGGEGILPEQTPLALPNRLRLVRLVKPPAHPLTDSLQSAILSMRSRPVRDRMHFRQWKAARGARAATRPAAAHRRAHDHGRGRPGTTSPRHGIPTGFAAAGLGRWRQRCRSTSALVAQIMPPRVRMIVRSP